MTKELLPLPMLFEAAKETVCGVCQLVVAKTNCWPALLVGKLTNRFESPSRAPENVTVIALCGEGLPSSETVKGTTSPSATIREVALTFSRSEGGAAVKRNACSSFGL